jgi:hypothetical protein
MNRNAILSGLSLIALGGILLLNNLRMIPPAVAQWWPVALIGGGVWRVGRAVQQRRGGQLVGGVVVSALGLYWLAQNLGRLDDRLFLPILLIALGIGLLARNFIRA